VDERPQRRPERFSATGVTEYLAGVARITPPCGTHESLEAQPAFGLDSGTSLAELLSCVILCEQTVILDSLHHLFNALTHIGVAVQ
jgi:hypothetical protein